MVNSGSYTLNHMNSQYGGNYPQYGYGGNMNYNNQSRGTYSMSPIKIRGNEACMPIGILKMMYWVTLGMSLLLYTTIFMMLQSATEMPLYAFLLVLVFALGFSSFLSKMMPLGEHDLTITFIIYGVFAFAILLLTATSMGGKKSGDSGSSGSSGKSSPSTPTYKDMWMHGRK